MTQAEESKSLTVKKELPQAVQQMQAIAEQIELISGGMVEGRDAMLLSSMIQSGYFKDADSLSKAVVRAAFGKRLGIDPMTAITSLYIIDGKPALEAKAIRNAMVTSGYTIKKIELSAEKCVLEFSFKGKVLGTVTFTKTDAVRRGYVDPTCTKYPDEHNERTIRKYNKWKKQWEEIQGCECKDNWKAMPEEMLVARATTKGYTLYGDSVFQEEVYDADEMRDSTFSAARLPVDLARGRIKDAKTVDELQEIMKDLQTHEVEELLEDINAKTRELLDAQKANKSTDDKATTETDSSTVRPTK